MGLCLTFSKTFYPVELNLEEPIKGMPKEADAIDLIKFLLFIL